MTFSVKLLFSVVLLLLLLACSNQASNCFAKINTNELGSLRPDSAKNDAHHAMETKDLRFVGVYGFTVEAPGTEGQDELVKKYGLRVIEGTTDAPCNKEHADLNEQARKYARAYNLELLDELKQLRGS